MTVGSGDSPVNSSVQTCQTMGGAILRPRVYSRVMTLLDGPLLDGGVPGTRFALESSSVADALHAELSRRLQAGDLPLGQQVTEAALARDYGVARTTARAAVERLAVEGLLRRDERRRLWVREFGRDDLDDLYLVREGLELAAVRRVAERGVVGVGLDLAHVQFLAAVASGSDGLRRTADRAFHAEVVAAADSDRLTRLHAQAAVEVAMAGRLVPPALAQDADRAALEHAEILDAVRAQDADRASRAVLGHLRAARGRVAGRFPPVVGG